MSMNIIQQCVSFFNPCFGLKSKLIVSNDTHAVVDYSYRFSIVTLYTDLFIKVKVLHRALKQLTVVSDTSVEGRPFCLQ